MLYQDILDKIVESCKQIFGSELTGVYLHGSLAMGCFNPEKSDLDLIIVIENTITDEQKMEFMQKIFVLEEQAPRKGIELSVVKKEYCEKFVYPTPFELHFSQAHEQWFREKPNDYIRNMKGTDKDLAAHFTIINRYGVTLYGSEINRVFGEVPRESYIDSIWYDIESAKEEVLNNPMYIILNLCRVVAYLKDNLVTSKKQGGEWGLQNLAPEYHSLLSDALRCYASGAVMEVKATEAQDFCEDILRMIRDLKE